MNGLPPVFTLEVLDVEKSRHGDRTTSVAGIIPGCCLAPGASTEDTDNRSLTDTTASVYCPPTTVTVTSQSKVRTPDGQEWDVEGDPEWWVNPFTSDREGGVIQLRRVRG